MARLLTWPHGLWGVTKATPINGPNARNSGSNTASDGAEQTYSGIGDVVALQLELSAKNGRVGARLERGLITALHSGANAIRIQFNDPDIMTPEEAGYSEFASQSWANGQTWANGENWAASYDPVPIAAPSGFDSGIVTLSGTDWGYRLNIGDYIGFFPFHFGLYCVTEVIDEGQYRIWPRLRKALTTDDYATLYPSLVMRLTRPTPPPGRDLSATIGGSISLVEEFDYSVREHFTD